LGIFLFLQHLGGNFLSVRSMKFALIFLVMIACLCAVVDNAKAVPVSNDYQPATDDLSLITIKRVARAVVTKTLLLFY
jgi:Flp pilus assembly protein TadG